MLVFSILFCGLHPFATRNGAETLREEIINKQFPYTLDCSNEEHIPLGGYNNIWRYLPEQIKTMLYNTFRLGMGYEAIQWYDAVLNYKDELRTRKYTDPEAYKIFPLKTDLKQKETDLTVKPSEPKAEEEAEPVKRRFEKRVFANAPTGRFVSQNAPGPSPFKPIQSDEPQAPAPAPSETKNEPDNNKKGRFFGFF